MVEVGTGGSKTRFVKTNWPVTEGLTAGTTKLHSSWTLEAQGLKGSKTTIPAENKTGML